jgi:hypothetical protein
VSDPSKFFTTCARHCEARAYQITVRQQAAKILELEKELSSVVAGLFSEHDLAIRDLDQQAKGLIKIIKDYGVSQFSGRDQVKYVEYENIRHTIDRLQKEAKALKDQG